VNKLKTVYLDGVGYFAIPDFIHEFSEDDLHHTFKGSHLRHITVERVLYKIMGVLTNNDAMPFYRFFGSCLDFLLGLNCNFPKKDVALYFWWALTKDYYDLV